MLGSLKPLGSNYKFIKQNKNSSITTRHLPTTILQFTESLVTRSTWMIRANDKFRTLGDFDHHQDFKNDRRSVRILSDSVYNQEIYN